MPCPVCSLYNTHCTQTEQYQNLFLPDESDTPQTEHVYRHPFRPEKDSLMRAEFARFLLVGVTNTLFSYLLYLLLLNFLPYLAAYTLSYCAGIVLSYFLNVYFVFRKSVSLGSFLKFPVVYAIQYSLGALVLWILVGAGISPNLAMLGVIVVTIPVTFIASRFVLKR
jgi:putative flippase GtrA